MPDTEVAPDPSPSPSPDPSPAPDPVSGGGSYAPSAPPILPRADSPSIPVAPPAPAPQPHSSVLGNILSVLGGVLGGPTTRPDVDPATGQIKDVPLSGKERAVRTTGIYLKALGAGLGPHGPGAIGEAAEAGAKSEQDTLNSQNKDVDQRAELTQRAVAQKAQATLQAQQIAESTWRMVREKQDVDEKGMETINKYRSLVASNPTNKDLGHYASFDEFVKAHDELQKQGGGLTAQITKGLIQPVPEFQDGKLTGVRVFQINPSWGDQKIDKPMDYDRPVLGKDGKVTTETVHIPAGGISNSEALVLGGKATNDVLTAQSKAAETTGKEQENAENKDLGPAKKKLLQAQTNEANAKAKEASAKATESTLTPETVDAIGTGHLPPDRLGYILARKPEIVNQLVAKYPDFDLSKAQSYPATYKNFTSGKVSETINQGATALQHLYELKQLNTDMSRVPTTAAHQRYENKADTVAAELAKFYGESTIPGIKSIKDTLTNMFNRDAAIKTQAKSMGDKLDNYEQTWKNAAPSKAYEAPMPGLSDAAKLARASLDPEYKNRLQAGGSPASSPTPQTHAWSSTAWQQSHPGQDVNAATAAAKAAGYQVVQ